MREGERSREYRKCCCVEYVVRERERGEEVGFCRKYHEVKA